MDPIELDLGDVKLDVVQLADTDEEDQPAPSGPDDQEDVPGPPLLVSGQVLLPASEAPPKAELANARIKIVRFTIFNSRSMHTSD